jgi:hypothetical protein
LRAAYLLLERWLGSHDKGQKLRHPFLASKSIYDMTTGRSRGWGKSVVEMLPRRLFGGGRSKTSTTLRHITRRENSASGSCRQIQMVGLLYSKLDYSFDSDSERQPPGFRDAPHSSLVLIHSRLRVYQRGLQAVLASAAIPGGAEVSVFSEVSSFSQGFRLFAATASVPCPASTVSGISLIPGIGAPVWISSTS